jgi:hypothetical protein
VFPAVESGHPGCRRQRPQFVGLLVALKNVEEMNGERVKEEEHVGGPVGRVTREATTDLLPSIGRLITSIFPK